MIMKDYVSAKERLGNGRPYKKYIVIILLLVAISLFLI